MMLLGYAYYKRISIDNDSSGGSRCRSAGKSVIKSRDDGVAGFVGEDDEGIEYWMTRVNTRLWA